LSSIDVVGEQIDRVSVRDFVLPASGSARLVGRMPRFLMQFLMARLAVRPRVVKPNCVACGACERACPVGAIVVVQGKARIERGTCIRCMCCHEVCRYDAIAPARSLLGTAIHGTMNAGRKILAFRGGAHRSAGDSAL
jgi:ferredoxin